MERAVFLDRDGTIIEDTGYVGEREKVRFLPRAGEAIRLLNENGFKVIVITNQAGVARGYYTEAAVADVNSYVCESLAGMGASVDIIYYCPHHVEGTIEEYRKDCYFRKPNPGMIEEAVRDFDIDLRDSFVIGDKTSDIEAGRRAGCRTILLAAETPPAGEKGSTPPDHIAPDLFEAVTWLLEPGRHGKE